MVQLRAKNLSSSSSSSSSNSVAVAVAGAAAAAGVVVVAGVVDSLLLALDNPTDPIHLHQIAAIRQAVSGHMADWTGVEGVNQLHHTLFHACCQVFPARTVNLGVKPWQTHDVQVGIKELWAKWRAFKQVRKDPGETRVPEVPLSSAG